MWNMKAEGCTATNDFEFPDEDGNKRPSIKKGDPLNDLFYRETTNDFVLCYGPWYLLKDEDVDRTNMTMPNTKKELKLG